MIDISYCSLTDEESRKNWEEYGNPDGPGAMQFGIALPKWLVEGNTSIWVLMSYVVVFMVILPAVVVSVTSSASKLQLINADS